VFGTSTMTLVSLVAHDQAAVGGRFIHGHAGLPVRAELGRNAEPAHPVAAHGRRLVARPQHAQGQRAERRTERRQRDPLDRRCRRLGEQQSHLLAAAAARARPPAGAPQTPDRVLVHPPVAQGPAVATLVRTASSSSGTQPPSAEANRRRAPASASSSTLGVSPTAWHTVSHASSRSLPAAGIPASSIRTTTTDSTSPTRPRASRIVW